MKYRIIRQDKTFWIQIRKFGFWFDFKFNVFCKDAIDVYLKSSQPEYYIYPSKLCFRTIEIAHKMFTLYIDEVQNYKQLKNNVRVGFIDVNATSGEMKDFYYGIKTDRSYSFDTFSNENKYTIRKSRQELNEIIVKLKRKKQDRKAVIMYYGNV